MFDSTLQLYQVRDQPGVYWLDGAFGTPAAVAVPLSIGEQRRLLAGLPVVVKLT